MKQFSHDVISGDLTLEYFAKKLSEGWKVAGVDWSREVADGIPVASHESTTKVLGAETTLPFGFQISEDRMMEENPLETAVLLLIFEQIVREKRIQEIAGELNAQGYRTRNGKLWGPTDVFNLLPRLIEVGPSLLKSTAWQERRPHTNVRQ